MSHILPTTLLSALMFGVICYDWRLMIIPDWLNLMIALSGMAVANYLLSIPVWISLVKGAAVFVAFSGIAIAYSRYRSVTGLGGGDIKFLAAASTWLTIEVFPWMVLTAALSGLAFASFRLFCWRGAISERLAFGPHLAFALMGSWLLFQS